MSTLCDSWSFNAGGYWRGIASHGVWGNSVSRTDVFQVYQNAIHFNLFQFCPFIPLFHFSVFLFCSSSVFSPLCIMVIFFVSGQWTGVWGLLPSCVKGPGHVVQEDIPVTKGEQNNWHLNNLKCKVLVTYYARWDVCMLYFYFGLSEGQLSLYSVCTWKFIIS